MTGQKVNLVSRILTILLGTVGCSISPSTFKDLSSINCAFMLVWSISKAKIQLTCKQEMLVGVLCDFLVSRNRIIPCICNEHELSAVALVTHQLLQRLVTGLLNLCFTYFTVQLPIYDQPTSNSNRSLQLNLKLRTICQICQH